MAVKGAEIKGQPKAEDERAAKGQSPRNKIVRLLERLEEKLATEELKASLGDFIRLVQLEKELADEETPREIKVTWVEPRTTSESAG